MKATVFKNNQNLAIRLPKALAFPEGVKTVDIVQTGAHTFSIVTEKNTWDAWFENKQATDDFMVTRDQPEAQPRDFFE